MSRPAAPTTARPPRRSSAAPRRRVRPVLLVVLFAAGVAVAFAHRPPAAVDHGVTDGTSSGVWWPTQGQAALVVGRRRPQASPRQRPVPIASLAKVMTAYLVLTRDPLSGAQAGFTTTITPADARSEAQDAAERQSVVPVLAGESLTERQLLQALLVPSGNNIAELLAVHLAGDESHFVAEMNAEAHALGMTATTYTDPSGFDPSTVSTAADQLRLLRRAMALPVFRRIVAMPSVTLPGAGTLSNFNPLIGAGYVGKTGSDSAAGGCLAFTTTATVHRHPRLVEGVVLGQGHGSDTSAILAAAGAAAQRLVDSVASPRQVRPVLVVTTATRSQSPPAPVPPG